MEAPAPALVLVTGPPAAGKTSLARPLARALGMPLLSKDDVKEILFDALGWSDRAWSRKLSDAAYEVMFHLAEAELAAGRSVMLEANFRLEAANRLAQLPRHRVLQVHCTADRAILMSRLLHRADQPVRHPGHVDSETLGEIEQMLDKRPAACFARAGDRGGRWRPGGCPKGGPKSRGVVGDRVSIWIRAEPKLQRSAGGGGDL